MGFNATAICDGLAAMARRDLAAAREKAKARPIGKQALYLGITDYRRKPDPSIYASDWAIWIIQWSPPAGWVRIKRLTARQTIDEAHRSLAQFGEELGLQRTEIA